MVLSFADHYWSLTFDYDKNPNCCCSYIFVDPAAIRVNGQVMIARLGFRCRLAIIFFALFTVVVPGTCYQGATYEERNAFPRLDGSLL